MLTLRTGEFGNGVEHKKMRLECELAPFLVTFHFHFEYIVDICVSAPYIHIANLSIYIYI